MPNRPIPRNLRPIPRNMRLSGEGPQDVAKRQAEAPPKPPAAPSWLSDAAREHWDSVAKQMQSERMWRPVFEHTLATYTELFAVFLRDPEKFGATKLGQLRLLAGDLGLTPSHLHRVARTHQ